MFNVQHEIVSTKIKISYNYCINSSVLSNVPSEINFDNPHCEKNSEISLSGSLKPKRHHFDINTPITKFNIHVENIHKL